MNCARAPHRLAWLASLLWAAALAVGAEANPPPAPVILAVAFEVNGQAITQAEFEQEALQHRAQVASERAAASAQAGEELVPVARLHEVTRAALVRLAVERALFREQGVPFPADYAALVAACERENQRRADAVERGGVVFGPKRFSVLAWRDYLHGNARIELQRRLVAGGKLVVPEEELIARFRALQAAGTIRAEATVDECRAALRAGLVEERYRYLLGEQIRTARMREIGAQ
jgi:hypothetical protein